ncbi:MAG: VOC family protein [Lysobacterales bacterium]|nr:MAG: VOC family protein [Xanthomonadales bacterium]
MPRRRPTLLAATLLVPALWLAAAARPVAADERYWPPIVDPATGEYTPGRWVWADLLTSDVALAAEFYGQVFGWTFETYGGTDDRDTYTLALADGLPVGGLVFDPRADRGAEQASRWIGLVSVPDPKAAAAAVTKRGGKVLMQPASLGERGVTAVLQDPEGALFGVVRSKHGDPADYRGDVHEWLWIDLWTGDVERAVEFYGAVAGYQTTPLPANGKRQGVRLDSGGRPRAGIVRKPDGATTTWLPYVRVTDARATTEAARKAGGRVLMEPRPWERAVVAIVADPTGAPVGVAQLLEQEAQP